MSVAIVMLFIVIDLVQLEDGVDSGIVQKLFDRELLRLSSLNIFIYQILESWLLDHDVRSPQNYISLLVDTSANAPLANILPVLRPS